MKASRAECVRFSECVWTCALNPVRFTQTTASARVWADSFKNIRLRCVLIVSGATPSWMAIALFECPAAISATMAISRCVSRRCSPANSSRMSSTLSMFRRCSYTTCSSAARRIVENGHEVRQLAREPERGASKFSFSMVHMQKPTARALDNRALIHMHQCVERPDSLAKHCTALFFSPEISP